MKSALKALLIALGQSSVFVQSYVSPMQKRACVVNHLYSRKNIVLLSTSAGRLTLNNSNGERNTGLPGRRRNPAPTSKTGSTKNVGERKKSTTHQLLEPSVVFSNNHLLLVNKPAGYHSQPNESFATATSTKCMLSKLKKMQLGGGSAKDFLLPMHRLDQPCTGILMLAKTSKAGTRIGNAFRGHLVEKEYFCVVNGNLQDMKRMSKTKDNKFVVTGIMKKMKKTSQSGSVSFVPVQAHKNNDDSGGRICNLEWEYVLSVPGSKDSQHLIRVRTGTGAKHQVRAMLSQLVKSPVCGDLRYGSKDALPDQSVALHGRSLMLPSVKLGDIDFKTLQFVAPIPETWSKYFSLTEAMIKKRGF